MTEVPDEGIMPLREIRALVLLGMRGMPFKEQVELLSRAGFTPKEIADFTGSTRNSVSVRLAELKRETKKNEKGG